MAPPLAPDFSSATYWSHRFASERRFEWLVSSAPVIPLVIEAADHLLHRDIGTTTDVHSRSVNSGISQGESSRKKRKLNILHFGAGTSSLGRDVEEALKEWMEERCRAGRSDGTRTVAGTEFDGHGDGGEESGEHLVSQDGASHRVSGAVEAKSGGRPRSGIEGSSEVRIVDADYVADSIQSGSASGEQLRGTTTTKLMKGEAAQLDHIRESEADLTAVNHSGEIESQLASFSLSEQNHSQGQASSSAPLSPPPSQDSSASNPSQSVTHGNLRKQQDHLARTIHNIDVLSPSSLTAQTPEQGWDIYLDKSTADAISCGPPVAFPPELEGLRAEFARRASLHGVGSDSGNGSGSDQLNVKVNGTGTGIGTSSKDHDDLPNSHDHGGAEHGIPPEQIDPLPLLLLSLAAHSHPLTRWISISYSSSRYHWSSSIPMTTEECGWKVVERRVLFSGSTSNSPSHADTLPMQRRTIKEKDGTERVVYEPEVGVWAWVLERV